MPGAEAPPPLRRSPTGRVPQWVKDEAAGITRDTSWRTPASSQLPVRHVANRHRGRRLQGRGVVGRRVVGRRVVRRRVEGGRVAGRRVIGVALVVGLVAATILIQTGRLPRLGVTPPPAIGASAVIPTDPDAGQLDHATGHPSGTNDGHGAYAFTHTQPGTGSPVTYDPCRPIHYVMRPQGEPTGGLAAVQEGIRQVAAATGLRFVYDGSTTEAPSDHRAVYQPDRYGDRWAPVLIAWVRPGEARLAKATELGDAGSAVYRPRARASVYVTGQVQLVANRLRMGQIDMTQETVLHELGHLVGLGHVQDSSQVMFPVVRPGMILNHFAAGDLAGLAHLGGGGCLSMR